jgi:hypothetical protein
MELWIEGSDESCSWSGDGDELNEKERKYFSDELPVSFHEG